MLNDWFKKVDMRAPAPVAANLAGRIDRQTVPPTPETLEEIYDGATIKPPKITYGIQKVTEMAGSQHLTGMSAEFKRKALLMALHAADTDEGEVLNDLVIRQRALKEYEDSYLERLVQFEEAQTEQNRQQRAELDKITNQYETRIQANLDDVERRYKEFRVWQENKRQEFHRFTEAAALCVPQASAEEPESVEEPEVPSNVTPMLRPTGTFR